MFDTIRSLLHRTGRPAPKRRALRCRPVVEGLEDRTVPSASGLGLHHGALHPAHHHAHHHATGSLARIEADLAARQGPGVTTAPSQGGSSGGGSGSNSAPASDTGNTPVTITGQPNPNVTHGTNNAVLTQRPTTNNQGQTTSTGTTSRGQGATASNGTGTASNSSGTSSQGTPKATSTSSQPSPVE